MQQEVEKRGMIRILTILTESTLKNLLMSSALNFQFRRGTRLYEFMFLPGKLGTCN